MSIFSEDLQAFNKGVGVSTPTTTPSSIGPSSSPIVQRSSFQQDLQNFMSDAPKKSDFGGVSTEIAGRANMAQAEMFDAQKIQQEREQEARRLNFQEDRVGSFIGDPTTGAQMSVNMEVGQGSIIPSKVAVNQKFGNKNPGVEVFSGGINYGVDFNTSRGTPVAVPPGEWKVVDSWGGAKRKGFIGNGDNSGYGNSVMIQNTETGEIMRFSHLDIGSVKAQAGQVLPGGTVFANTGNTGNSTGDHLDLEYINAQGKYADVLKSPYKNSLFGKAGGGGNPLDALSKLFSGFKEEQAVVGEISKRYDPAVAEGARISGGDSPTVSRRAANFVEEKNIPLKTLFGALAGFSEKNPQKKAANKAFTGQDLSKEEQNILSEASLATAAGFSEPISGVSVLAKSRLPGARALRALSRSRKAGTQNVNMSMKAIEEIDEIGRLLPKNVLKKIQRENPVGPERTEATVEAILEMQKKKNK